MKKHQENMIMNLIFNLVDKMIKNHFPKNDEGEPIFDLSIRVSDEYIVEDHDSESEEYPIFVADNFFHGVDWKSVTSIIEKYVPKCVNSYMELVSKLPGQENLDERPTISIQIFALNEKTYSLQIRIVSYFDAEFYIEKFGIDLKRIKNEVQNVIDSLNKEDLEIMNLVRKWMYKQKKFSVDIMKNFNKISFYEPL